MYAHRDGDTILFHHEGGVDIGDVDSKAVRMDVPILQESVGEAEVKKSLLGSAPAEVQEWVSHPLHFRIFIIFVLLFIFYHIKCPTILIFEDFQLLAIFGLSTVFSISDNISWKEGLAKNRKFREVETWKLAIFGARPRSR